MGIKVVVVSLGCAFFGLTTGAQRAPYPSAVAAKPAPAPTAAAPAPPPQEVRVDQECRILPDAPAGGKKPHPVKDLRVCHLEAVYDTEHVEQMVVGTELQRSNVEVFEQQYVLHNVTLQPELFVVQQPMGKGWTIESDPPPVRVAGKTAYFQAWVQPGKTVKLHVGMRHPRPMKPKVLKVKGQIPGGSATTPLPVGSIRQPDSGVPGPPNVPAALQGAPGPQ